MNAMLVGADRLGNIPEVLRRHGIEVLRHITGRDASDQRRTALPRGTQLLILFTDFLNHNAMKGFRRAAEDQGVPVLACRRSVSCLTEALGRYAGGQPTGCGACLTGSGLAALAEQVN
jgi:hypothetical protein